MKIEYWIIGTVALLLFILGFAMAKQTDLNDRQVISRIQGTRLAVLQDEITRLEGELTPAPYHPPLDEIHVSSGTGFRVDPMGGDEEALHKGTDLSAPVGSSVYAIMSGFVVEHWPPPDGYYTGHPVYGGYIILDHGTFFSSYGHLSETYVHRFDTVTIGQIIGLSGNTGISTGAHLHFEIVVDPFRYLEKP